jgi:hypothetical protein
MASPGVETWAPSEFEGYLGTLQEAHDTACKAVGGAVEIDVIIAGEVLRLSFAGEALVDRLAPAFSHLRRGEPGPPNAHVSLWDTASTGVERPPSPWRDEDVEDADGVGFEIGRRFRLQYDPRSASVTGVDLESRSAVYQVPYARAVPWYDRAAPLLMALHWLLMTPDRLLAHGGVAGIGNAGALLAGKGGSGKSTLAVAGVERGLEYVGDDYVLLSVGTEPIAHSAYATAKLDADSLQRLPGLARDVINPGFAGEEKAVVDLGRRWPARVKSNIPLRMVVTPSLTGRRKPRVRPVAGSAAMLALAPSTIFQLGSRGPDSLRTMAELARRVPSYALELGSDLDENVHTLASLLHDAR